jgi:hypothetical protein
LVEGNGWDRYRLANPKYFEDYVRHGFPMGRLGTAEEVADVVVFAASLRAHWINGRNIPVGRPGAAACTTRPPPVLDPPARVGAASQEMTMPSDPLSRPLIEITRDLREGWASARELVEAAIDRHERFGERLHAYSFWAPDQARTVAKAADAAFAAGVSVGPLQGLPVSLKDLFAAAGISLLRRVEPAPAAPTAHRSRAAPGSWTGSSDRSRFQSSKKRSRTAV